jgi:hypothetical protein
MSTIEMPKTYTEQLDELEVGESILIDKSKKPSWQTTIGRFNDKVFSIRTSRDEKKEIRVWRLQ